MRETHELGVLQAARAIAAGALSSEELTRALSERVQRHRSLNAFVNIDFEYTLALARERDKQRQAGVVLGPLHGVPITFKDNIDVAGVPTTAATPALRSHIPAADSPVTSALVRAGAIVFGKNTMHELAFGITCNNRAFGAVHNPYDRRMIPGGSSGGTAAAVAARLAPAGIGTDTGGSVRVPAALCGIYGMRPTLRRWAQDRIVPIACTRDTAGPLARRVEDLALLDSIVTGCQAPLEEARLEHLRIGLPHAYFWQQLDPDVERSCREAVEILRRQGATIVEADLADIGALNQAVSFPIALREFIHALAPYLQGSGSRLDVHSVIEHIASPDVKAILLPMFSPEPPVSEAQYVQARDYHRPRLMQCFIDYFARHAVDAVIFPCTPLPARPIGQDDTVDLDGVQVPTFPTFIRNTDPGSDAGLPGVTVPVGMTSAGLPIGLALDGPPNSDRRLLAIAATLEQVFAPLPAPALD